MRQQLIQLLIAMIVVLPPVLNWLYQTLKKQKERRDAEAARQRRELEQLRTGRAAEEPAVSAEQTRRQREVNQRREAELAELRRRIGTAGGQPAGESILIQIPGSSGPIVVQRAPRTRTEPEHPAPQRRPQRAKRGGRNPRTAAVQGSPRRMDDAPDTGVTQRLIADGAVAIGPPAGETPAAATLGVGAWTAEDWRRAFVIREVLGSPLALRGPDDRVG